MTASLCTLCQHAKECCTKKSKTFVTNCPMCGHRAVSHNALVSHLRIHTLDAPKCKRCHHSCLDCTTTQERIKATMKNNPQSLLDTAFELSKELNLERTENLDDSEVSKISADDGSAAMVSFVLNLCNM
uniref:(northern house mosquito) hypothetical protein n=2 Tax=Culex pipiens TaxID=7175 RepID=A0A8D8P489_CULPI